MIFSIFALCVGVNHRSFATIFSGIALVIVSQPIGIDLICLPSDFQVAFSQAEAFCDRVHSIFCACLMPLDTHCAIHFEAHLIHCTVHAIAGTATFSSNGQATAPTAAPLNAPLLISHIVVSEPFSVTGFNAPNTPP